MLDYGFQILVNMHVFNAGTIEEKIYQRQISKQGLSGAVVDISKGSEHIRFSIEELRNLFILHEDSQCVTHDLLECKCMGKKDDQGESYSIFGPFQTCYTIGIKLAVRHGARGAIFLSVRRSEQ